MTTTKIWECKIGEVDSVAGGSDYPMRQAVAAAYKAITGVEPVFIFSGWGASLTEYERAVVENRLPAPATAPEQDVHPDDKAVDRFAGRMKWKLANARAKGKSGWQDRSWTPDQISAALRQHVDKGDPTDVANYCMFLAARGEPTTSATAPSWQDAPTKPGMWACLYMGELSTATFNAYEIEHFYASEMGGCRWQFIPDEDKP